MRKEDQTIRRKALDAELLNRELDRKIKRAQVDILEDDQKQRPFSFGPMVGHDIDILTNPDFQEEAIQMVKHKYPAGTKFEFDPAMGQVLANGKPATASKFEIRERYALATAGFQTKYDKTPQKMQIRKEEIDNTLIDLKSKLKGTNASAPPVLNDAKFVAQRAQINKEIQALERERADLEDRTSPQGIIDYYAEQTEDMNAAANWAESIRAPKLALNFRNAANQFAATHRAMLSAQAKGIAARTKLPKDPVATGLKFIDKETLPVGGAMLGATPMQQQVNALARRELEALTRGEKGLTHSDARKLAVIAVDTIKDEHNFAFSNIVDIREDKNLPKKQKRELIRIEAKIAQATLGYVPEAPYSEQIRFLGEVEED
jgi:hypothetical protein